MSADQMDTIPTDAIPTDPMPTKQPEAFPAAGEILGEGFLNRPTLEVTRDLLGQFLCRQTKESILRWELTEIEAYDGPQDKACHASRGKTPRNAVMFGPAGHWYVYLCYGIHWLANIITGPVDYPAAVLIRGAGEVRGPGRVTKALRVDQAQHEAPALPSSGFWLESSGQRLPDDAFVATPRIGIGYAGEWVDKPYRYLLKKAMTPREQRERGEK